MRNRHLCVDPLARTVGPTLRIGVGGPAGCKEAAKRRTEAIRTVGPTLRNGDNNMKLSTACLLITFSVMLVAVKPLAGHHSFDAEYDSKKPINVSGTVTKLDWVNPHAFVFIDAKDESGAVKHFKIEMGPPYALVRGGWKRDTVKIGDNVTVEAAALAKDGSNAAGSEQTTHMILADGTKLPMR